MVLERPSVCPLREAIVQRLKKVQFRAYEASVYLVAIGLFLLAMVISIDYNTIGDYSSIFYWIVIVLINSRSSRCSSGKRPEVDSHWILLYSLRVCQIGCILTGAKTLSKNEEGRKKDLRIFYLV